MTAKDFKIFLISENNIKDRIFLLEKLSENSGFFAFNDNLAFVTKSISKQNASIATKYVEFIPNTEITSVCNYPTFEKGMYDFLVLKEREDEDIINSFSKLCNSTKGVLPTVCKILSLIIIFFSNFNKFNIGFIKIKFVLIHIICSY